MALETAPSAGQLEVSLFGRGYGESVAVHLGDGQWMIVDSLLDQDGVPPTLKYLELIGVDTAADVKLVVGTHWHDDHAAGLSQIYERARSATLALPAALKDDEMKAFRAKHDNSGSDKISSGVRELSLIALKQASDKRAPFRMAKANTNLLRFLSPRGHNVTVEALSPSDFDIETFIRRLAELPPTPPGTRAEPFDENEVSVAIWVSVENQNILLGADLEESNNAQRGWKAIIASPAPVIGKASVLKVPHHGSLNAHSDDVWKQLLEADALACMTTWNRGRKLPKASDVERICSLTSRAFITSGLSRRPAKYIAAVEKTIRESGIKLLSRPKNAGHIRLRLDIASESPVWVCELFGDARALSALDVVE